MSSSVIYDCICMLVYLYLYSDLYLNGMEYLHPYLWLHPYLHASPHSRPRRIHAYTYTCLTSVSELAPGVPPAAPTPAPPPQHGGPARCRAQSPIYTVETQVRGVGDLPVVKAPGTDRAWCWSPFAGCPFNISKGSYLPANITPGLRIPCHCNRLFEAAHVSIVLALPLLSNGQTCGGHCVFKKHGGCRGGSTSGPPPASPARTRGLPSSALPLSLSAPRVPHTGSAVPQECWAATPLLGAPLLWEAHCMWYAWALLMLCMDHSLPVPSVSPALCGVPSLPSRVSGAHG